MKILVLGLDKKILENDSEVSQRALVYGTLVDYYEVLVPFFQKKEIQISLKVKATGSGGKNKIFQFFNLFKIAKKTIIENRINVISVQDVFFLGLLAVYLSKKFKVGLEVQVHGWEKYFGIRKIITKFVLRHANSIRVVSQRLKKELLQNYNLKEEKITVVPVLLKPKINNDFIIEKPSKFIFLTVGRLVKVKNIDLQIKAVAELKNKGLNFEWWVIGDGVEKNKLQKLAKQLLVSDKIKFLGFKKPAELQAYYKVADCFVLTSSYEGWGMAVVEAMRFGLPIIMTDVGCAGELIKNNESGLVIKNNLDDLLIALIKIFDNSNLRQKLSFGAEYAISKLPEEREVLNLYLKSWGKAQI